MEYSFLVPEKLSIKFFGNKKVPSTSELKTYAPELDTFALFLKILILDQVRKIWTIFDQVRVVIVQVWAGWHLDRFAETSPKEPQEIGYWL